MKTLAFLIGTLLSFSSVQAITFIKPTPEVTAKWTANEDKVTKYIVSLGTKSGEYTKTFETTSTTIPLTGLVFDVTYYAVVKAQNDFGTSDPSDEVSFLIKKSKSKYIEVLTSKDGGKTWVSIGEVLIPPPVVTGQKYKTKIVTK